jgi:hypothetical protein
MATNIDNNELAASLRLIARGIEGIARVVVHESTSTRTDAAAAAMTEWGTRGLSRGQTSDLFKKHGLRPQTSGGWARGGWIEVRHGMRFLTDRSLAWLQERAIDSHAEGPFEH